MTDAESGLLLAPAPEATSDPDPQPAEAAPTPTPPAASPAEEPPREPTPPPPELGTPDGAEELPPSDVETGTADPEPALDPATEAEAPEPIAASAARASEELMADPELRAAARAELSGEASHGFATVLLASPREQLDIAHFFGEELLLIPRASIDPRQERPHYFRLDGRTPPRVERVDARPPLESWRQYRDLFDYEYAALPNPLRELRRSVLARGEIYLFAALVPAREWAVVVGRRREALEASQRAPSEVRRYVLRYQRRADAGYDLRVEEIQFTDGSRFQPQAVPAHPGGRPAPQATGRPKGA